MKTRIGIWAVTGFLLASAWALLAAVTSPGFFLGFVREPLAQALLYMTCPVAYLGQHYPIKLWSVLLTNAATFGTIGLLVELIFAKRRKSLAV